MVAYEWTIEYYVDDNGKILVRAFILTLDPKIRVRIQWSLDQLQVRHMMAWAPLVKHLEGKIWEIREES